MKRGKGVEERWAAGAGGRFGSRQTERLWWCRLLAKSSQDRPPRGHPRTWLRHPEAAGVPASWSGPARRADSGSPARTGRSPAPGRDRAPVPAARGQSPRVGAFSWPVLSTSQGSAERTPSPPGTAPERSEQGRGSGPRGGRRSARGRAGGGWSGGSGDAQRLPRLPFRSGGAGEHGPDAAAPAP